ncbi:MAG: DUF1592 domain-containing protein [Verrucomicrobiota bacterium]|nr:DUF1592 domain-containing protein [Verrucomicrobiota bacterium]
MREKSFAPNLLMGLCLLGISGRVTLPAEAGFETIRPILEKYCLTCHSTEKQKGELDLEQFSSLEEVRKQPKIWQSIVEQISLGEMPPKDKSQLATADRDLLLKWIEGTLNQIALENAGDPGPVVLRRLSNAEYTYTIRDLTGVDSLDPAREFPVDGAAGEGFMNVGNSLVMSPSLVTKYLDAAKSVASHAMLLPHGIRFSASNTRRDWTEEIMGEIRGVYGKYSVPGGGTSVNLQGIKFDTRDGGVIPMEKYIAALIQAREGKPIDPEQIGLSARYFKILQDAFNNPGKSLLLDSIRTQWLSLKTEDAPALAEEIFRWQKALWKFSSVGHIGKAGGPKAWLEPFSPLSSQQEFKQKLSSPVGDEFIIYLAAGDAGDGVENDIVQWKEPRLVAPDGKIIPLRSVWNGSKWGVDPELFGKRPDGSTGDPESLYVKTPSVLEIRLPASLALMTDFVVTGLLDEKTGAEGSVQLQALTNKPVGISGLRPTGVNVSEADGPWYSNNQKAAAETPIIVRQGSATARRFEAEIEEFRNLFPAALCYTKIVPVDEVVTLTLFHREDQHLARLMLTDSERTKLDRLWAELRFVSEDALTLVDVFDQLWQYATQDADPGVFEPMRQPIRERAVSFRKLQEATEPVHLAAVLKFANDAYRRPLNDLEQSELRTFYQQLRKQELPHDEAIRLSLARVLTSPSFLYRAEKPGPGRKAGPVTSWEMANRLSFFLWSSAPDLELRTLAANGKLQDPEMLKKQARRMLKDWRIRRLATEFACAWLHIYDFDELNEKSDRHFPTFLEIRSALYEEPIRFFTDLFQNDRPVREILDADYSYLNEPLARHYGIPGIKGKEWQRVDGMKRFSRGGILGQAAILAKQSGASRTSPILRGNWVSEVLIGEKLPRPPKDVPQLPEEEGTEGLTMRQLTEKHTTDPRCAGCHARIDAFGFALEHYDAIGRWRETEVGDRAINTKARAMDGTDFEGLEGLRNYLLNQRGDAFLKQFCRKLLGYALGRSVQLSDGPLLDEMISRLKVNEYRVSVAVETIVLSRQFREIRGRETADEITSIQN